jgi:hypothetical protein
MDWVRRGGLLVYSPAFGDPILDSLHLELSRRFIGPIADGLPGRSRFLEHPWTGGVEPDTALALWALERDDDDPPAWTPLAVLATDSAAVSLAWLPFGEGGALVVAQAQAVENGRLADSAMGVVMTRAILDLLAPGDTVVFSEYHQGGAGSRGLFREVYAIVASTAPGRARLLCTVIAVVLLVLSGRAFGTPVPEPERDRRSPLEHVEALGRIYEGATSDRAVARRLVQGAARRSGGRPSGTETDLDVLEAWGDRPDLAPAARLAIAALRRDPPDLVRLSSALDMIVDHHAPKPRHS